MARKKNAEKVNLLYQRCQRLKKGRIDDSSYQISHNIGKEKVSLRGPLRRKKRGVR